MIPQNVNAGNLLRQVETFSSLFQLNPITQLSMLHAANQPRVPEATPVPGFEKPSLLVPMKLTTQDIAAAFDFPQGSYFDELMSTNVGPGSVDELFEGRQFYNLDQNDFDQLPDPTVFDELPDDLPSEPFQRNFTALSVKEEVKSPVSCDSQSVFSYSSASPPYSPSISEAGSRDYSTDEGIQSDFSDFEEFLETMSSQGSPLSISEEKQPLPHVKNEPIDATPRKATRRKRGPKPPVKYRGDGPIQLWQFLLELIIDPAYSQLIKWTHDEDYEFKILQPTTVAKMWGKKKNKPTMNYEKLSRGLRYYYGKSVIEKVHGKRYVYQFMCDIPKILGYDPMVKNEEFLEEAVCGEPVMSTDVDDLLSLSSVEDSFFAGSIDFSALY